MEVRSASTLCTSLRKLNRQIPYNWLSACYDLLQMPDAPLAEPTPPWKFLKRFCFRFAYLYWL